MLMKKIKVSCNHADVYSVRLYYTSLIGSIDDFIYFHFEKGKTIVFHITHGKINPAGRLRRVPQKCKSFKIFCSTMP